MIEIVWVLQGPYQASKEQLLSVLETLLRNRELMIEHSETACKAARPFAASKADFADCMIERFANEAGCEYVATFDKAAAKMAGMRLLV